MHIFKLNQQRWSIRHTIPASMAALIVILSVILSSCNSLIVKQRTIAYRGEKRSRNETVLIFIRKRCHYEHEDFLLNKKTENGKWYLATRLMHNVIYEILPGEYRVFQNKFIAESRTESRTHYCLHGKEYTSITQVIHFEKGRTYKLVIDNPSVKAPVIHIKDIGPFLEDNGEAYRIIRSAGWGAIRQTSIFDPCLW